MSEIKLKTIFVAEWASEWRDDILSRTADSIFPPDVLVRQGDRHLLGYPDRPVTPCLWDINSPSASARQTVCLGWCGAGGPAFYRIGDILVHLSTAIVCEIFVFGCMCLLRCCDITMCITILIATTIRERVQFKLACLVHQSLSGQSPAYLADDCRLVLDSTCRSLRSADVPTCVLPRTVMATEPLQLLDLDCGTHYQSSCAIQTSATDDSHDSWKVISSRTMNTALCDLRYAAP